MAVRVVTDAGSDIAQEEAGRLGITVVPVYIRFGDEIYRDGIDIGIDEFYHKLANSPVHPATAAPSPGEFAEIYERLAEGNNQVVSIHITRKHSAVMEAALVAKEMVENKGYQVEVIDSQGITIWQALVASAAAKAASSGCDLQQVVDQAHRTINRIRGIGLLDTLRYAIKGGRLSNTIFKVESLLNIKPLLTIRDGEIRTAGITRTWNKGLERLRLFIKSAVNIEEIVIASNTNFQDAQDLADYASSYHPDIVPIISRVGPTMGVHTGPGTLIVAIQHE